MQQHLYILRFQSRRSLFTEPSCSIEISQTSCLSKLSYTTQNGKKIGEHWQQCTIMCRLPSEDFPACLHPKVFCVIRIEVWLLPMGRLERLRGWKHVQRAMYRKFSCLAFLVERKHGIVLDRPCEFHTCGNVDNYSYCQEQYDTIPNATTDKG